MDPKILQEMLGIEELKISSVRVDHEKKEFYVNLQWKRDVCDCRTCGLKNGAKVIKAEPREQPVRHLDCLGYKTLLYFEKLEMECWSCKALFNMPTPFLTRSRFLTDAFIDDFMTKTRDAAISAYARWTGQSERSLQEIYFRVLRAKDASKVIRAVRSLGIDEVSLLKGHGHYVTILYDLDSHDVIELLPGKSKELLMAYFREHQSDMFNDLRVVCMDMCRLFRDAVKAIFPNVEVVVDRFHVERALGEVLDDRRKDLQRKEKDPEKIRKWKREYRWALLRSPEREFTQDDSGDVLQAVLEKDEELARLYWLKNDFRRVLDARSAPEAEGELRRWVRRARYLASRYLTPFLETVKRWKREILGYVKHGVTTAVCEGLNCKIKLVKRMGYGLPNFDNFRLRILHTCSELLE